MAETFVVALESEPPERSSLRNPGEVRRAVFESIEKWHPHLGGPVAASTSHATG